MLVASVDSWRCKGRSSSVFSRSNNTTNSAEKEMASTREERMSLANGNSPPSTFFSMPAGDHLLDELHLQE
jgi:hypothetical protein